ncbi:MULTISPECIES: hypothetical protein [Chromobacterium]|uniref:PilZ domain-containing protein n=1 Tax=Chromobacterium rhizoryzae TaxID=1778675 RepID=A0AAD0RQM7_9NEIS|nr:MULTISPECIES: hypothetical protein [Chromobacterium]AXT45645.1 hypothetical protein D1345_05365 [Chromobacterium rhizoryzae]PTU71173.1 hypothetical protein DBB33_17760 [Chromobacterium haemolyticum]QOD83907.1 hypothetical protein IEZ30_05345 [Chromobacterium haemolyticum]
MLDFFSRGAKGRSDPLASAEAAREFVAALKKEHGAAAHERVVALLSPLELDWHNISVDRVEALLALNQETESLHENLCAQYLLNTRMPKALEAQLRSQILAYGKCFIDSYQHVLTVDADSVEGAKVLTLLPIVLSRMMFYLGEHARWHWIRSFNPEEAFWLGVNQLYWFAEHHGCDSVPVFLFGDGQPATTVQDQFLILHMLAVLTGGNLSARQLHFAYQLLQVLSNRMSLTRACAEYSSFVVSLKGPHPATRATGGLVDEAARYWGTTDLVEILHGWSIVLDAGRVPPEIKRMMEPGIDANTLRALMREWSPQQMRFERAERVPVSGQSIEVAYRLPVLHRLIRGVDEAKQTGALEDGNFDDAANIRIYGFVTTRKRDKGVPMPGLASGGEGVSQPAKEEFSRWEVDNVSQTGLGVTLGAMGNEWVGLGALIGFREKSVDGWSLGVVRRVKRNSTDQIYLGVETLSRRPVAASLRPTDVRLIDPTLPPEQVWLAGHIALFVPCQRSGKVVNALLLPLSLYVLGKEFYMTAKGKHFQLSLGKVMDKGSDWCLSEVELVQALERLPVLP